MDPSTKAILDRLEASLTGFQGQKPVPPPSPSSAPESTSAELVRDKTGFLVRKDMLRPAQTPRVRYTTPSSSLSSFIDATTMVPNMTPDAADEISELVRDVTGFPVRKDMLQPPPTTRVQDFPKASYPPSYIDPSNMANSSPKPKLMIQTRVIQAIEQYNKHGDYSAAYLARAIGISLLGKNEFVSALEMAQVKMVGKYDKDAAQSTSFTALRDMILVWENVVGTGDERSISWVKKVIEKIHGEGVLAEEEKKWKDGVKVGVEDDS